MDQQLLTLDEAAQRLGIHVATLRAWVREGRVPAYRLGKRFARVRWDELVESLATQAPSKRLEGDVR